MGKLTVTAISLAVMGGATSVEEIAKAIGYGGKSGKISSQTINKIRELVPEIDKKIKNRTGQKKAKKPAVAKKTPKAKKAKKTKNAEKGKKVKIPVSENTPLALSGVINTKAGNPYFEGTLHHSVFEAAKTETVREMAVAAAAKATGRARDTVSSFLTELSNAKSRFNAGRSMNTSTKKDHVCLVAIA